MGAVAKSYMRKGFLIYKELRKYLVIYEAAVSHIWICNRSLLDSLYIWGKFCFLFYQCGGFCLDLRPCAHSSGPMCAEMSLHTLLKLWTLISVHIIGCRKTKLSMDRKIFLVCEPGKYICISVVFRRLQSFPEVFRRFPEVFRKFSKVFEWKIEK